MKLLVAGATGSTGRQVVEQALARGHEVVAIARHPERLEVQHTRLVVFKADVLDAASLVAPMAGVTAVISAVGAGTSREPTQIYSSGVTHLLTAMQAAGTERLVVVSAEPAGPWESQPRARRWLLFPILEHFFGASYADMRRMETLLAASSANWVSVRPPRLLARPARGHYRLGKRGSAITYGDLASALLDLAEAQVPSREALSVAN